MDEILTTIDTLGEQLVEKKTELTEGTLPFRLIGFAVRSLTHIRRIVTRVEGMTPSE